jgi:predicted chitinase
MRFQEFNTGTLVTESQLFEDTNSIIKEFLPWLQQELQLEELPKIKLLDKPEAKTFGMYGSGELCVVTGGRHPVDVLRTLAHELTHYKQDLEGRLTPNSGETGSEEENEANSNAGVIMRKFAQENPEHFGLMESLDEELSRRGFLGAMGAGAATAAVPGIAQAKPTALSKAPAKPVATPRHRVDPHSTKVQPLVHTKQVDPEVALKILSAHAIKSGMTEPTELAQFLAQCAAETGYFKHLGEIGRPSKLAHKYSHSTGNQGKSDALMYAGRGFIQLTGKGNYISAGKDLYGDESKFVENPDLAADLQIAAHIATWFWNKNVKSKVSNFTDTASVTRAINGRAAPAHEIKKRDQIFATYFPAVKNWVARKA